MRLFTTSLWATLFLGLSTIGCTSSNVDSAEITDSVYTDETVYVTEDGRQVDPSEINLDDYEIVDETISNQNPTDTQSVVANADTQLGEVLSSINAQEVEATNQVAIQADEVRAEQIAAPPTNSYVSLDSPDYISLDSEQTIAQDYVQEDAQQTVSYDESNSDEYVSLDIDDSVGTQANVQVVNSSEQGDYVVVQAGDSLSKIARSLYGKLSMWKSLQARNQIANADLIFPGDRIYYDNSAVAAAANTQTVAAPPIAETATSYVIQPGDTLSSIAQRAYGSTHAWKQIQNLNPEIGSQNDELTPGRAIKLR